MTTINTTKIIAGVSLLGIIVGGAFIIDRTQQPTEIKQMRTNLVEKANFTANNPEACKVQNDKCLTHNEFKQLIKEYNAKIAESKDKKDILENINTGNKETGVIKRVNDKLIK